MAPRFRVRVLGGKLAQPKRIPVVGVVVDGVHRTILPYRGKDPPLAQVLERLPVEVRPDALDALAQAFPETPRPVLPPRRDVSWWDGGGEIDTPSKPYKPRQGTKANQPKPGQGEGE